MVNVECRVSSVICWVLNVGCPLRAADLPGQSGSLATSAPLREMFNASCTKSTNQHDFRKRNERFILYDVSLHERHEYTRFPQAEDTIHSSQFIFRTKDINIHDFRKRKTRFILRNSFFARKTRIYTISASGRHDSSFDSCPKNRVIDLSISCHSCHSCYKRIGGRLVDIVSYVPKNRA